MGYAELWGVGGDLTANGACQPASHCDPQSRRELVTHFCSPFCICLNWPPILFPRRDFCGEASFNGWEMCFSSRFHPTFSEAFGVAVNQHVEGVLFPVTNYKPFTSSSWQPLSHFYRLLALWLSPLPFRIFFLVAFFCQYLNNSL